MDIFKKTKWSLYNIKKRIRNYFLVKKYPWLHPISWEINEKGEYEERRDPKYKYEYVQIFNDMPGWWRAFGKIFCDEIQEHFNECPNMYVLEVKEKYGSLRISFGNADETIEYICDKYSHISANSCYFCGHEAPMINAGWLLPVCQHCYEKEQWGSKPYREVICNGDDGKIPDSYTIRCSGKNGSRDVVYDISDTVKKIRANYAKNR